MKKQELAIRYKSLPMFFVAANSLMLSGYVAQKHELDLSIILLLWIGVCGIFIVYRFNDFVDQSSNFKFNAKLFFKQRINLLFFFQFVVITLPVSFFVLSAFRLTLLAIIAILGVLYSINFTVLQHNFRLKNVFLVKNILIGIAWGALVLIGANSYTTAHIQALFVFCSLQVVIGSIIRDIPDVSKDTNELVKSLPVVLGISTTLKILHVLNVATLTVAFLVSWQTSFLALTALIVAWRFWVLHKIKTNYTQCSWTQYWNLITCVFILIINLFQLIYASKL
jgi:4-hydroxybenzoate polyprenyltransferase